MSIFTYFFFSQEKGSIEDIKNAHAVYDVPRIQEKIKQLAMKTSPEIEEIKKDVSKPKNINKKIFVLSSTIIGIYEISLNSYIEDNNTSKKETLHCMLKLKERELFFDLSVNKSISTDRNELFISVTTNNTHTVTEDAYLLKSLDEDTNYLLMLTLYYDYVSLSLIKPEDKKEFIPIIDSNLSKIEDNLKFSVNGKLPINIADTPLEVKVK